MSVHVAFFVLSLAALSGCGQKISQENIEALNRAQQAAERRPNKVEEIKSGLTEKEVESLLGRPAKVEEARIPVQVRKEFVGTRWYYEQDGKMLELNFIDGKLQHRAANFGEPLPTGGDFLMKKEAAK